MDYKNILIVIFICIIVVLLAIIASFVINDDTDSNEIVIKNNNTTTLEENKSIQDSVDIKKESKESSQHTPKQESASSDNSTPDVDSSGITREVANQYGYTYTEEHGGHYIGSNDRWDEENQCYHD